MTSQKLTGPIYLTKNFSIGISKVTLHAFKWSRKSGLSLDILFHTRFSLKMFLFWSHCCFKEVENSDCAQYPLKFFKGCLPQNLLSPLLNTLSQIILILEPKYSWSSRLQMFYKVCILKNLAKFTGKHLCWRHFLIKMWAQRLATSLENDSDTGLFL